MIRPFAKRPECFQCSDPLPHTSNTTSPTITLNFFGVIFFFFFISLMLNVYYQFISLSLHHAWSLPAECCTSATFVSGLLSGYDFPIDFNWPCLCFFGRFLKVYLVCLRSFVQCLWMYLICGLKSLVVCSSCCGKCEIL